MPFRVTVKDGPPLTAARGQALKMGRARCNGVTAALRQMQAKKSRTQALERV